ncbi:MAG: tRNA glutamyl-Q(34) synthetase GluQRS [Planctomycetes bacterium]|nr:tRNA glutamyl-Q(34) synthetase GluQRS [Planctomycetota bacterium]
MNELSSHDIKRGRLAPTPSGLLHLGNARTFLATWLSMRSQGGEIILRIEDIDRGRSRPEFEEAELRDLEWLGLDWDIGPVRQSERFEHYREALEGLIALDLAYPCVCTRRDIEAASAPHDEGGERLYPNTCRGRFASLAEAEAAAIGPVAWRVKAETGPTEVNDIVQGKHAFDTQALVGDFVVWTKEGWPSYQLAVMVDDALQGISEVVRGRDLLASAARQIELADALSMPHAKRWAHLGLVTETGQRMAQRAGSTALAALRESGIPAEQVLGRLAHGLGLSEHDGPVGLDELIERFDWARIPAADLELG